MLFLSLLPLPDNESEGFARLGSTQGTPRPRASFGTETTLRRNRPGSLLICGAISVRTGIRIQGLTIARAPTLRTLDIIRGTYELFPPFDFGRHLIAGVNR